MDKFMTVVSHGIPFHVRLVEKGDEYGLDRCLTYDKDEPMVEFYDARYVKKFESIGQFVSNYYVTTLISREYSDSRQGLQLQGDINDWYIDGKGMMEVFEWLEWVLEEEL
jgi:hypothetical protein